MRPTIYYLETRTGVEPVQMALQGLSAPHFAPHEFALRAYGAPYARCGADELYAKELDIAYPNLDKANLSREAIKHSWVQQE